MLTTTSTFLSSLSSPSLQIFQPPFFLKTPNFPFASVLAFHATNFLLATSCFSTPRFNIILFASPPLNFFSLSLSLTFDVRRMFCQRSYFLLLLPFYTSYIFLLLIRGFWHLHSGSPQPDMSHFPNLTSVQRLHSASCLKATHSQSSINAPRLHKDEMIFL